MKNAEGVDQRLARLGRATADIVTPPDFERRILAAIVARERAAGAAWDVVWSSSRHALVVSLCTCAASIALALHLDARLVTTLASVVDEDTDIAMGDP